MTGLTEINNPHQMSKLIGSCLFLVFCFMELGATPLSLPPVPLSPVFQSASDGSLAAVRQSDRAIRTPSGKLSKLSPGEHLRRATIYMTNRAFAEAREHWEALLSYYPEDPSIPSALFGIGRSYFPGAPLSGSFLGF
jgi:hypothetical protein